MTASPHVIDEDDINVVDAACRWITTRLAFGGITYDSNPYAWSIARCLAELTDRWTHTGDTSAWVESLIPRIENDM